MDNTRLTIACEENREGGYEIDVTFERESRIKFREAFISLDRPMPPYLIEESDINGVGAVKSAATRHGMSNFGDFFTKCQKPPKICGD